MRETRAISLTTRLKRGGLYGAFGFAPFLFFAPLLSVMSGIEIAVGGQWSDLALLLPLVGFPIGLLVGLLQTEEAYHSYTQYRLRLRVYRGFAYVALAAVIVFVLIPTYSWVVVEHLDPIPRSDPYRGLNRASELLWSAVPGFVLAGAFLAGALQADLTFPGPRTRDVARRALYAGLFSAAGYTVPIGLELYSLSLDFNFYGVLGLAHGMSWLLPIAGAAYGALRDDPLMLAERVDGRQSESNQRAGYY